MNPILLEMMAKQRHEDLMREAEHMHLTAFAESNDATPRSRFLVALGDALIRAGKKLKQGHEHKMELSTR